MNPITRFRLLVQDARAWLAERRHAAMVAALERLEHDARRGDHHAIRHLTALARAADRALIRMRTDYTLTRKSSHE